MRRKLTLLIISSSAILAGGIILSRSFSPSGQVLAQGYPADSSSSSLFGGIDDAARNFFEGVGRQFYDWFYGGGQPQQGGSELPHPTASATPEPGGPTPTPGPYLNLGDMIQLDTNFTANCVPDLPPDELHNPTENKTEYCDWTIPEDIAENRFVSDTKDCVWTPVKDFSCLQDYSNTNLGYQDPGPSGCIGESRLSVCLIKVYDSDLATAGPAYFHLHWRLELIDNDIDWLQSGERAAQALGVSLTETVLFGVHRENGSLPMYGQAANWLYSPTYFWPRPNRQIQGALSSPLNNCGYQTGMLGDAYDISGTIQMAQATCDVPGRNNCCADNQNIMNLRPYEFMENEASGEALIAMQVKPRNRDSCSEDKIDGCYWNNYGGRTDVPSEYTVINKIGLTNYLDQTGYNQAPGAELEEDDDIPCNFLNNNGSLTCQGCEDTVPQGLDDFLSCQFLPDPQQGCVATPDPTNTFGECPTTGCDSSPLDLCWGLYDPSPGRYAPLPSTAAGTQNVPYATCVDTNPWEATAPPVEGVEGAKGWSCRYQVPAANIVEHIGGECNQTESLGRSYRMCDPLYFPATIPEGIYFDYYAYVRKLNGCNAYFRGDVVGEGGGALGTSGTEQPPAHTGYCQNDGEDTELLSGEVIDTGNLCNTTDGMRCVDAGSSSNVCRKAIRVETFETSYRTTTPPPDDAFTANCLKRVGAGVDIDCGEPNCSKSTCPLGCECTTDPDLCKTCGDGSKCDTSCSCEKPAINDSCTGVSEGECYYPVEGDCSGSWDPTPCDGTNPTANCPNVGDCCKTKSYCFGPQPAEGYYDRVDGPPNNQARNCAVYEWTRRENMYTVVYDSNAISANLQVKNLSQHPVPATEFNWTVFQPTQWDAATGNFIPLDLNVTSLPAGIDPNSYITVETEIPDFVDYRGYTITYSDRTATRNMNKEPRLIAYNFPPVDTHGGTVKMIFSPLPAAGDPENGNASFTIKFKLVPAVIGPGGESYYKDTHITDKEDISYYINSLPSDDRLVNLEFATSWANAQSVELMSFWIGQGVLSTAPPCQYGGAPCYTDAEAIPYGWPNLGKISQDWGGSAGAQTFTGETIVNPLADIYGPRTAAGVYARHDGNWYNAGIDIIPAGETSWSPYIYSTQAGYVTFAGNGADIGYPGRGYYVEIQSTIDDDCQPNYVTRYTSLAPGSLRVAAGEYVPRHKLLGLMGDSGTPGYVHVHYTIVSRNPNKRLENTDIPDNNEGEDMSACDVDPDIDPPTKDYFAVQWLAGLDPLQLPDGTELEPDDVHNPSRDYYFNPYQCYGPNLCHPDPSASPDEVCHFCTIRRKDDELQSCFYANP